jgi:hypothetical protein
VGLSVILIEGHAVDTQVAQDSGFFFLTALEQLLNKCF